MALNQSKVGYRYPTVRYEVSREKVREYAAATGVRDPQYDADRGEVVAPPTFAACFTLSLERGPFADPELGTHPNLVHGGQEFTFHRPVRVGDVLDCTTTIAEIRPLGRTELLTTEVECVDAATAAPVVTARSTLLFLNSGAGGSGATEAAAGGGHADA